MGDAIDVGIIGGGPAGLTAALNLSRMGWRVRVFDANRPRNAATLAAHAVLGREGISPLELRAQGAKDLAGFGGEVTFCRVTELSAETDSAADAAGQTRYRITFFKPREKTTETVTARTVLLASGVSETFPEIENLRAVYGTSLHSCLVCDLWEKRGQHLALIGHGPDSQDLLRRALSILPSAEALTVFYPGFTPEQLARLEGSGIRVVAEKLKTALVEQGKLVGLEDASGEIYPLQLGFVRPIWTANLEYLQLDLARQATGNETNGAAEGLAADEHGRTSRAGIWAAGDLTGIGQISIAAGQGAKASLDINRHLFGH